MYDNQRGRSTWEFEFAASAILAAVLRKIEHHQARLAHWNSEKERAEKDVRERGLTFEERLHSNRDPHELVAKVDPELTAHLSEVNRSVKRHGQMLDEYAAWKAALENTRGERQLSLTVDDVEYFGLHKST